MLVPAISRAEEIKENFLKFYYTDEMFYYMGCFYSTPPRIAEEGDGSAFQYAVVDNDNKLIGYICYTVDWYSSNAYGFGLISFDKNNPLVGTELRNVFKTLIDEYKIRRIEWRMVGGNPVERHYDKFCKKYNGNKLIAHRAIKDPKGVYHDNITYEIFPNEK